MDSFDPLSFEAPEVKKSLHGSLITKFDGLSSEAATSVEMRTGAELEHAGNGNNNDDRDDDAGLIHILDLPLLTKALPRSVIITMLKLLEPEQETNFGQQGISNRDPKAIDIESFEETREWLSLNGYTKLSKNLIHFKFTPEVFSYLNKILSSRFFQDEEIAQLISLRISENSGRTARPNFQRRITLNNFDGEILLNEPALTSDSLGLKTWGSSLILSEYIIGNKDMLLKEPILELGAGTGLVGITISLLGYDITLTDLPEILPNLTNNVKINRTNAECAVLDWTNPACFLEQKGDIKYYTIVIADPIYSSDHPVWVVNMIKLFLKHDKDARILLQIPIRAKFEVDRQNLWNLLEEQFKTVNEQVTSGFDDFGAQEFLYKELRWREL